MKTNSWQLCLLQQGFEDIEHISCWVEMGPQRGGKHIVMVLPGCTCLPLCLSLFDLVLFEGFYDKSGKHNAASSLLRLWLCFHKAFPWKLAWNPGEDTANLKHPSLQVKILPL